MLKTALHNGINFTGSANRASGLINFGLNSSKNIIPRDVNIKYLLFYTNYLISQISLATLTAKSENVDVEFTGATFTDLATGTLIMFQIPANQLYVSKSTFFELKVDIAYQISEIQVFEATEFICSDIFEVQSIAKMQDAGWVHITAKNNDNRHGFLANEAFGFFQKTGFNEDVFINKKTEYEYSYGRKKILSSENNIAKRLTFKNLSTYQQILLKWLCNSENLFIDGVQYELISDFTELLTDENSEVKDLRADFVEVEHSFFATGSNFVPKNNSPKEFYLIGANSLTISGGVSGVGSTEGGENPGTSDHTQLINKNGESTFQHVDTTITKENLDAGDKVSILDVNTGKMVMVDKDKLSRTIPQEIIDLIYAGL